MTRSYAFLASSFTAEAILSDGTISIAEYPLYILYQSKFAYFIPTSWVPPLHVW